MTTDTPWSVLSPLQLDRVQSILSTFQHTEPTRYIVHPPPTPAQIRHAAGGERSMADQCTPIDSPFIAKDENGRVILVYVPDFVSPRSSQKTVSAVDTLLRQITLKSPENDVRHTAVDTPEMTRLYGEGRYGTLHCAVWMERGKPYRGPVVSREMQRTAHTNNATTAFIHDLRTLKDDLSLLYAAVCPTSWRRCVDRFNKLQKYINASAVLCTSPADPWSSLALVSNLPSRIHCDWNDTHEDLSGLGCCGTFGEAWLVLFTLGIRLRYRPQDAVLLNTKVIPHFVDWDSGDEAATRHSMSFFNHQDVWDWVKNEYERRKASD